jgi:hypothetical protein
MSQSLGHPLEPEIVGVYGIDESLQAIHGPIKIGASMISMCLYPRRDALGGHRTDVLAHGFQLAVWSASASRALEMGVITKTGVDGCFSRIGSRRALTWRRLSTGLIILREIQNEGGGVDLGHHPRPPPVRSLLVPEKPRFTKSRL